MRKNYTKGLKVVTDYGTGTIIKRDGEEGICRYRYLVFLDKIPENLEYLHKQYGGLYYNYNDISLAENS